MLILQLDYIYKQFVLGLCLVFTLMIRNALECAVL